jgi:amino acid transporter/nucleotide-binding universal stress UspA family protein
MELETTGISRPRNVDWKRAAALLYGDWGTSKAYVTGMAFALGMYSSFWFVLAVGVLTAIVGLNYIWVCKYFPEGGGVYSAAHAHSRHLALIGGFLLVANYLVTAALSCFEAFVYFGFEFEDAKRWAILVIFIIGVINFFGPRHSGTIAAGFAVSTLVVMVLLAVAAAPHIPAALASVEPPQREPWPWWIGFTGVILALSGVESIANMTGVMHLDPHATASRPSVSVTARKAILVVMIEVVLLTTLFGLVMHAIPGMGPRDHEGDMLRHLGQVFVDDQMKQVTWLGWLGERNLFSTVVSLVIGGLLLSATNTAIVAMVSVLYLMSKDGEMPPQFGMLNRFGVPWILMLMAILGPILVLDIQSGERALHGLADLYAIGVVGAIVVNLGSCAFNFKLPMLTWERGVMLFTFVVVAAIEVTIAVTKPWASMFAAVVLCAGFAARAMHKGFNFRLEGATGRVARLFFPALVAEQQAREVGPQRTETLERHLGPERPVNAIMVSSRGVTPTLRFAVEEARRRNAQLFVLFVREVFTTIPVEQREQDDPEAQAVFSAVRSIAGEVDVTTIYAVSDDPAWTILDNAAIAGVDMLILGHSRRLALTRVLRGDLLQKIGMHLPEEIRLVIVG